MTELYAFHKINDRQILEFLFVGGYLRELNETVEMEHCSPLQFEDFFEPKCAAIKWERLNHILAVLREG